MPTAFDPIELGDRKLTNRIVMSPMTRSRAYGLDTSPTDDVATYYAQRAYDRHGFHGGNNLVLRTILGRRPTSVSNYIHELAAR